MQAQNTKERQGDLFADNWLPYRPLAGNNFHEGMYPTTRENALTKMHIQSNPPSIQNLLVVDIDHDDSVMRAMWDRDGWRPNWVAENPANGHAHAVWVVADPIVSTSYQHRKPLGYAYAVTEGLRRSVDGDIQYPGKFMKNPLHEKWELYEGNGQPYELSELDAHLSEVGFMPPHGWWKSPRVTVQGIGRNCTLFENARKWAYRQIPQHRGDPEGLANAIELMAMQFNVDEFEDPLSYREVKACAHSISKWITTRSTLWKKSAEEYERDFAKIQSARGKKSAVKRVREKEAWMQEALGIIEGSG